MDSRRDSCLPQASESRVSRRLACCARDQAVGRFSALVSEASTCRGKRLAMPVNEASSSVF
eukprot:2349686-Pleurochrysis_carterae.AAC.3